MRKLRLGWMLLPALVLGACDNPNEPGRGVTLRAELIRLRGGGPASAAHHPFALSVARAGAVAAEGGERGGITSDVRIESLEVPIREISIVDFETGEGSTVYQCGGQGDACLVDLASASFERNLLNSGAVRVREGVYDAVKIEYCRGDDPSEGTVYVKATAELDGRTYYTRSDGSMSPTGPAERAEIPLGCGASILHLPYSVTVTPDEIVQEGTDDDESVEPTGEASLRLYFTMDKIAWAISPMSSVPWGVFCMSPLEAVDPDDLWLCVGYPELVGFLDSEIPELERYSLDMHTELTFFLHENEVMGGYFRLDYTPPFREDWTFEAPGTIYRVNKNPDGTLELLGHPTEEFWSFRFPAFSRSAHTGEYFDHGQTKVTYTATPVE